MVHAAPVTNPTLATQAADEARQLTLEYDAKLSDEMRVLGAWFGYWAGLITNKARRRAVDGPFAATEWACAREGHETLPAVTDYPDGIHRCHYCYTNDAAIRRFERIETLLGFVEFVEPDLPPMAPAIEEPAPAVLGDSIRRFVTSVQHEAVIDWTELGYVPPLPPPYVDPPQYDESGNLEPTDEEVAAAMAERDRPIIPERPEHWSLISPPPPLFDCAPADVSAHGQRLHDCVEAELLRGRPDGVGSGFAFDYKTTPPPSWTDMPPLTRRQRWWFAATDSLADAWRWLNRPRVSVAFVALVFLMSTVLSAWIIGHRTTTIIVTPRSPMTCTPVTPNSPVLHCRSADQP